MSGSKISSITITALALIAVPSSAIAKDREPIVLTPTGPWQLDMGEHNCRMGRIFEHAGQQTLLIFDQWDPSRQIKGIVAGPAVEDFRPHRNTDYRFGENGDADEFEFIGATFPKFGDAVEFTSTVAKNPLAGVEFDEIDYSAFPRGLPKIDSEGAAGIDSLTLSQRGRSDVVLKLGNMKAPLDAMNICMKDLVQHWGFDPEEQSQIVTPPKISNLMTVARRIMEYYPSSPLNRGGQADFHIRLTVDERGEVEECIWLNQTLAEDFDMVKHPCSAFKEKAEIEPARDAGGKPIKSFYATRVVYRMG